MIRTAERVAPARPGAGDAAAAGGGLPPDSVVTAPRTSQGRALAWTVGVFLFLVPIALWQIEFSPGNLVEGWRSSESFRSRAWPPEFVDLGTYASAMGETVAMVVVATVAATLMSIPLAFLAASNTTTGRGVQAVARGIIVFWRAVPDVVIAIVFRLLVGIGPLAGVVAMALHSIGMLGKLFADAIEETDPGPRQALEAQGASRLQVYATAVVPQVVSGAIAAVLYRFDINIRISVILGFVGAGGVGSLLRQQQGQLVWPQVLGTAIVILLFIVALEQLSTLFRRSLLAADRGGGRSDGQMRARIDVGSMLAGRLPVREPMEGQRRRRFRYGAMAGVLLLAGLAYVGTRPLAFNVDGFIAFWSTAWPPNFLDRWEIVLPALLDTFWIAIAATAVGVVISVPFGILGARNAAPSPAWSGAARFGVVVNRGVPEIVLAVFFVVLLGGLGAVAGFVTLAIAAIGFTGKLMADQIEEAVRPGPVDALRAAGAGWWQRTSSGVWPQAVPGFVATSLYTFDVNFRAATILGIVGAGGIGSSLFQAFSGFDYDRMLAIIIEIFIVVYLVEQLSVRLRRALI